jgi:CopG family nickel-responsive transcriptional regulator
MKQDDLVRFGVSMDRALLEDLDALVEARGVGRSEVLRDLVRAEVVRSRVRRGVPAVATLTLVYDHHVRELTEKINAFQHGLGEKVRSTLHVHLDAHRCLEVVVLRGRSDHLQAAADRLLATRGVTHGSLEVVADEPRPGNHPHDHDDDHEDEHEHEHAHPHAGRHAHGRHRPSRAARTR